MLNCSSPWVLLLSSPAPLPELGIEPSLPCRVCRPGCCCCCWLCEDCCWAAAILSLKLVLCDIPSGLTGPFVKLKAFPGLLEEIAGGDRGTAAGVRVLLFPICKLPLPTPPLPPNTSLAGAFPNPAPLDPLLPTLTPLVRLFAACPRRLVFSGDREISAGMWGGVCDRGEEARDRSCSREYTIRDLYMNNKRRYKCQNMYDSVFWKTNRQHLPAGCTTIKGSWRRCNEHILCTCRQLVIGTCTTNW